MRKCHPIIMAVAWTAVWPASLRAADDPAEAFAQFEDFAQTRVQQCDELGRKADQAFQEFEPSASYQEIQRIKARYQAQIEALLPQRTDAGELTAESSKRAATLQADYDKLIRAQEQDAHLHQLNQLYLQSLGIEKQYADLRSQVLVWCLLSDRVGAQKEALAGLEHRQAELEKRAAEIAEMFRKDPEMARQNQALLDQAQALLAESAAKLAAARKQYSQSVEQARKVTKESDDDKAVSSIQSRVASLRGTWNRAKIKLAAMKARLHESHERGVNATVGSFRGRVEVRRGDGPFAAARANDVLLPGDAIRTGPDGRAAVTLSDGSRIEIGPRSILELDPKEMSTGLLKSGMLWLDGAIKKLAKNRFEVRTPVAVLAVRGTDVVCIVGDKKTTVIVGSGEVDMTPKDGGKAVRVESGSRATWEKGRDSPVIESIKDYEDTLTGLFPDI